jgi:hypothetical protein
VRGAHPAPVHGRGPRVTSARWAGCCATAA